MSTHCQLLALVSMIQKRHVLTPLRLNPKKDPHPPPKYLEYLHSEYPALKIIEVIQVRRKLKRPRTPQQPICYNGCIVDLFCMEIPVPS